MPVLASYTLTHQWARELQRWHPGPLVTVYFRVPDQEPVTVGHYGAEPLAVNVSEAVAVVRDQPDPRGYEVFVPRSIAAAEVRRVRNIRPDIGWRYHPKAHGQRPCPCPYCSRGMYGAADLRRRYSTDPPRRTKPESMAALREAVSPREE
jgi:hypothetical protein